MSMEICLAFWIFEKKNLRGFSCIVYPINSFINLEKVTDVPWHEHYRLNIDLPLRWRRRQNSLRNSLVSTTTTWRASWQAIWRVSLSGETKAISEALRGFLTRIVIGATFTILIRDHHRLKWQFRFFSYKKKLNVLTNHLPQFRE